MAQLAIIPLLIGVFICLHFTEIEFNLGTPSLTRSNYYAQPLTVELSHPWLLPGLSYL